MKFFADEKIIDDILNPKKKPDVKWKKLLGILPDGTKVFEVDGLYVREVLKNTKFVGGGHWLEDPEIPKGEYWIEDEKHARDSSFFGAHEFLENLKMQLGLSYDDAHDWANAVEGILRQINGP
jgi:hypothetical protein